MKAYILVKGAYAMAEYYGFNKKEDLLSTMDAMIKGQWTEYESKGKPLEYRNAKRINFETFEDFYNDRKMEYNIMEIPFKMKPHGWLRCNNCYATGYVVEVFTSEENQTLSGRITNEHCTECNGTGHIEFK